MPTKKKRAAKRKPTAKKRAAKAKPTAPKRAAKAKPTAPRRAGSNARTKAKPSARDLGLTVEQYVNGLTEEMRALCTRVLSVVADAAPDAQLSIKWGQPVFEKNGPFAWIKANKGHVGFGFWRGAQLDDPSAVLEGDGQAMRHVKLLPGSAFDANALRAFVHQAVALNITRGDPTSMKKTTK